MGDGPTAVPRATHAAIIASTGRPTVLAETVASLRAQTVPPDLILISVADPADVLAETASLPGVLVIRGPRGSSVQRNRALDHLGASADLVSFFDDDVELPTDHLACAQALFARDPEMAMFWGLIVADGAGRGGLTREQAHAALGAHVPVEHFEPARGGARGALGGDMHVRRAALGDLRFDERLALYGWQEDRDLASRCARRGKVGQYHRCAFVHLGVPSGRVPGHKYGFAQVMNPFYLWRKGSLPAGDAAALCAKAVARNAVGTLLRERRIDRAGRFKGNLVALGLLLRNRVEPEYVAELR